MVVGKDGEEAGKSVVIEEAGFIGLCEVGLVVVVETEEGPPEEVEQYPPLLATGTADQTAFLRHYAHLHNNDCPARPNQNNKFNQTPKRHPPPRHLHHSPNHPPTTPSLSITTHSHTSNFLAENISPSSINTSSIITPSSFWHWHSLSHSSKSPDRTRSCICVVEP